MFFIFFLSNLPDTSCSSAIFRHNNNICHFITKISFLPVDFLTFKIMPVFPAAQTGSGVKRIVPIRRCLRLTVPESLHIIMLGLKAPATMPVDCSCTAACRTGTEYQ